ncbi:hypothetical protein [Streptomyces sp. NPDC001948]
MREPPGGDPGVRLAAVGFELLYHGEEAGCGGFDEGADLVGEAVGRVSV